MTIYELLKWIRKQEEGEINIFHNDIGIYVRLKVEIGNRVYNYQCVFTKEVFVNEDQNGVTKGLDIMLDEVEYTKSRIKNG